MHGTSTADRTTPIPQYRRGTPLQVNIAGEKWAAVADELIVRLVRLRDRARVCRWAPAPPLPSARGVSMPAWGQHDQ